MTVLSQKNIHFLKDPVFELVKSGETTPEEVVI